MLRLVCIDVDGTLIGETGKPTSGVLDAIIHARSLGQTLALSTARGAMGPTADYASLLNPSGWHIFHAGASLVHTGSSEIIGEALPKDIIRIGTELSGIHGWALEYYSADDYRSVDDSLADSPSLPLILRCWVVTLKLGMHRILLNLWCDCSLLLMNRKFLRFLN